ncbi:MAG TPA: hypothetical protein ENJ18_19065 [Nannocystis exedens]|nr:hypothetical protein [Nannocystis exedens]
MLSSRPCAPTTPAPTTPAPTIPAPTIPAPPLPRGAVPWYWRSSLLLSRPLLYCPRSVFTGSGSAMRWRSLTVRGRASDLPSATSYGPPGCPTSCARQPIKRSARPRRSDCRGPSPSSASSV